MAKPDAPRTIEPVADKSAVFIKATERYEAALEKYVQAQTEFNRACEARDRAWKDVCNEIFDGPRS